MMKLLRYVFFVLSFLIEIEVNAEAFTKISVEKSLFAEIMQKVSFTDFEVAVDTWQTGWTNSTDDKSLNVIELTVLPDQKRFNAVVAWGDPAKGGVIKKVSGNIKKFMMLPVLSAPVGQKTAITESNISYVRFSDDQVNAGMALRKEDIVGKFLKAGRSLQFDKPLQLTDLEVPVLIKKGEAVRIKYVDRFFEISIAAIAKSNGCAGEKISFEVGTEKKKIIQATVLASGQAEIRESL
jgi:flagella basal body P-ring formation protein FlgA